jgi:hypothetical protein
MTEPMLATASPSFYKRPLPPSCIPFSSTRGKQFFAAAMNEGHLESYFTLAGQCVGLLGSARSRADLRVVTNRFLTQNEPAFCGLGTLCMILNALEIDPQRKWKGPWRWYEQEVCYNLATGPPRLRLLLADLCCSGLVDARLLPTSGRRRIRWNYALRVRLPRPLQRPPRHRPLAAARPFAQRGRPGQIPRGSKNCWERREHDGAQLLSKDAGTDWRWSLFVRCGVRGGGRHGELRELARRSTQS